MANFNQINLAIDLAKSKQNKQAEVVKNINDKLNGEQERLNILNHYMQEYYEKHRRKAEMTGVLYHNFYDFLETISQNIDTQRNKVQQLEKNLARQQEVWFQLSHKTEAFIEYSKKQQQAQDFIDNQREQEILDELHTHQHVLKGEG